MRLLANLYVFIFLIGTLQGQNNALSFDGVNDYVQVPDNGGIEFGPSENFSIEMWLRIPTGNQNTPNGGNYNSILEKVSGTGGFPYAVRYQNHFSADPGKIQVLRYDGIIYSVVSTTSTVNDSAWHHLALVKTGSVLQLYLDGVLQGTATDNSTGATTNASPLFMGRHGNASDQRPWKGSMDQLRIWNDARTAEEVTEFYTQELTGDEANLVALYHFNTGIPGGNNAGQTMLEDATNNTNNGTLTNFALTGSSSNFVSSNGTTSEGFIGIGTTNPHSNFHLKGNSWTSMTIEAITNDPVLQLTDDASDINNDWTIRMDKSNYDAMVIRHGSVDNMTLNTNGAVGIGTNLPATLLDVYGTYEDYPIIRSRASGWNAIAVHGINTNPNGGIGIIGETNNESASNTIGVGGVSRGQSGRGVYGLAYFETGTNYGVIGESISSSGIGVRGFVIHSAGNTYGVQGDVNSSAGTGVFGNTTSNSGTTRGVHGRSQSNEGTGVYGIATAGTGTTTGVFGTSASPSGRGVYGESTANTGSNYGVYGKTISSSGIGVNGESMSATGVVTGVRGITQSTAGRAVFGYASASTGITHGVLGWNDSADGRGVTADVIGANAKAMYGVSSGTNSKGIHVVADGSGSSCNAILAQATGGPSAYAGWFTGKVHVDGNLSKASGSFKIDHPLDPENKYLFHSFVESPDMMNIYNGNITTDNTGYAEISLPDYFEALNMDFRYQLTVIGEFAQAIVSKEIHDNRFAIRTDKPHIKVSWQVTGVRQDPYAVANRIVPEVAKEPENRGKYLTPKVYHQPANSGINYEEQPVRRSVSSGN